MSLLRIQKVACSSPLDSTKTVPDNNGAHYLFVWVPVDLSCCLVATAARGHQVVDHSFVRSSPATTHLSSESRSGRNWESIEEALLRLHTLHTLFSTLLPLRLPCVILVEESYRSRFASLFSPPAGAAINTMDTSSPAKRRSLAPLDANVHAMSPKRKLHNKTMPSGSPIKSPIRSPLGLKRPLGAVVFDENSVVTKKRQCQEPVDIPALKSQHVSTAPVTASEPAPASASAIADAPTSAPAPAQTERDTDAKEVRLGFFFCNLFESLSRQQN